MAGRVKLCAVEDVPAGEMLCVEIEDTPSLAVFNVDGEFYATSNVCTHNVALLTDGYFEGDTVECPLHGGCFNVKTGEPTSFPCEVPLRTYGVIEEDGQLYAEL